jgi:hypothetical protein
MAAHTRSRARAVTAHPLRGTRDGPCVHADFLVSSPRRGKPLPSSGCHSHLEKLEDAAARDTAFWLSGADRLVAFTALRARVTFRTTAACDVLLPGSQALQTSALGVRAGDAFLN